MGMFDKDKQMAPDGYLTDFAPAPELEKGQRNAKGTTFALVGAKVITDEFVTPIGTSPLAHLAVMTVDDKGKPDGEVKIVSALGAPICDKVKQKEPGDLPALVYSQRVASKTSGNNDAFVINFVRPLEGDEYDIPEIS